MLTTSIDLAGKVRSQAVIPLFHGVFDGRGHTIRNLHVEGQSAQGLFGLINRDGEVRNLGVENVYVEGRSYPAGLVGENMGRVLNCYSTGRVIGTGHAAGGLVGSNWGTVADSYSTATVNGPSFVGGLVGLNTGTVSFCHSTGDVTGYNSVGGLVEKTWVRSHQATASPRCQPWACGPAAWSETTWAGSRRATPTQR